MSKAPPPPKRHSVRTETFVAEYLKDLNGSRAAVAAGYAKSCANVTASKLLAMPEIKAKVEKAMSDRASRVQVDADWVLRRLHADATADLSELYDDKGALLPVKDWPAVWRTGLVSGVETVQEQDGRDADGNTRWVTVRKVKLLDRTKLIELIGKHVGVGAFRELLAVDATVKGSVTYKANMPTR
jgi:phage terminase small subunit